ncbi:MAG: thioredoxin family protein [Planctomycetota bacterium]
MLSRTVVGPGFALAGCVALLAGGLAGGCAASGSSAAAASGAAEMSTLQSAAGDAEVVVVAMHADWCGACQRLGPKIEQAAAGLSGQPVQFVKADLTNRDDPAAEATLSEWGLGRLYDDNRGRTGLAYVVDADTGEVLDTITAGQTPEQISADVTRAIASAG